MLPRRSRLQRRISRQFTFESSVVVELVAMNCFPRVVCAA
jgi:hypothetical protein